MDDHVACIGEIMCIGHDILFGNRELKRPHERPWRRGDANIENDLK
jgi:hypothetical protein